MLCIVQATVFETDFNQERKDRERAVSEKSDLQKENQDLIKQNEVLHESYNNTFLIILFTNNYHFSC